MRSSRERMRDLCGWNLAESRWDLAECGWDLAECRLDRAECGGDLSDCGWDLVDCGWNLTECWRDLADCGMRSSRVWKRSIRAWTRSSREWKRSSRVVTAPGCQWQSRNNPGFDPSILRHSVIWRVENKAALTFCTLLSATPQILLLDEVRIKHRTVATLALTVRRSNLSARSHPHEERLFSNTFKRPK